MRLQLLSDLHLERDPSFEPKAAPGVDVLVLAGDIGSYQAGSRLTGDDFGLGRFSPLRPGARWPVVLYVPGNHEFDGLRFRRHAPPALKRLCAELGITWLERETVTLGARALRRHHAVERFRRASPAPRPSRPSRPSGATRPSAPRTSTCAASPRCAAASRCWPRRSAGCRSTARRGCGRRWPNRSTARPWSSPISRRACAAPTRATASRPAPRASATRLDDWLPQADLWLHGHLHCANDYVAEGIGATAGRSAAASSPTRWAMRTRASRRAFRADLVIELPG